MAPPPSAEVADAPDPLWRWCEPQPGPLTRRSVPGQRRQRTGGIFNASSVERRDVLLVRASPCRQNVHLYRCASVYIDVFPQEKSYSMPAKVCLVLGSILRNLVTRNALRVQEIFGDPGDFFLRYAQTTPEIP